MDRKQGHGWKGEGSAKLSLVLLVLNVVMLVVAAARLFCPEGELLPHKTNGVNLEGICAAAEAALGVLSSGDMPRLDGAAAMGVREQGNAHLGLPSEDARVVVITSGEGPSWEEVLRLPEGTVYKVFVVEAAPDKTPGRM